MSAEPRKKVVFVTGNAGKLAEVRHFLEAFVEVESVKIDLPELQAASGREVSRVKALEAFHRVNDGKPLAEQVPVLVEDTGLSFDVMGDLPGPYIKWFLEQLQPAGLAKMVDGFCADGADRETGEHRNARATCTFAYCIPVPGLAASDPASVHVELFDGVCPGRLLSVPRGTSGFGWDCVFAPAEQPGSSSLPYAKTYAEMTIEEKGRLSHRTKALEAAKSYLLSHAKRPRE